MNKNILEQTAKEVILLAKGWYDREKYPSVIEALKEYYYQHFSEDLRPYADVSYLLEAILWPALDFILTQYPDRTKAFLTACKQSEVGILYGQGFITNEYHTQMCYRIMDFFRKLRMRGDGVMEIDTSMYFEKSESVDRTFIAYPENRGKHRLKKPIII